MEPSHGKGLRKGGGMKEIFKKILAISFVLIQIDISLHPGKSKTRWIV